MSKRSQYKTYQLEEENEEDKYNLFHKSSNQAKSKPLVVRLEVQGSEVQMQIHTGSSVSLISEATFQEKWSADNPKRPTICPSQTVLCTYTGEPVYIVGECKVL